MRAVDPPEYESRFSQYHGDVPPEIVVQRIYDLGIKTIAIDTETHYDPTKRGIIRFINGSPNNVPFGLSLTIEVGNEYESYWVTGIEQIREFKNLLEDESISKILHNSKYDRHMLANIGIDLAGPIWDTMVMIHLIDEEQMCRTEDGGMVQTKALKHLAYHYLGEDGHELENLVDEVRRVIALREGRVKSHVSYKEANDASPIIMRDYACADTEFSYRLFRIFLPRLVQQDLTRAYQIDIDATYAVFQMERVGLGVDQMYYEQLDRELTEALVKILSDTMRLIPIELNIRSSRDLVKGFEALGVEWKWYTAKGEYRTDDKILHQFTEGEPAALAELVLSYREKTKLRDTFISQIREYNQGGRIHADFNVCPRDDSGGGTVTGRLSSNAPNLHNLPKDDKRIRKGIVPAPGYVFVEMDYDFYTLVVVKAH